MTRFLLLCKRQLMQPSFCLLCLLLPITCLSIHNLEENSQSSLSVGLYTEPSNSASDSAFLTNVFTKLTSDNGSIVFQIFTEKDAMLEQTARNELDCAYSFDEDLYTKLLQQKEKNSITCYTSPSTIMDALSREVLFAALFQQLGKDIAVQYMKDSGIFEDSQIELVSKLYHRYQTGNKVFSLEYQYLNSTKTSALSKQSSPSAASMPIRGFIAVLLLVSGLTGGITWLYDKECKLSVSAVCSIFIPLFFMSLSAIFTLFLTKEAHSLGKEFIICSLYLLFIIIFVRLLLQFIKNPTILTVSVPVLTLGSLIFCPIFVNLSTLMPFFQIMEKLFPPYYYLLLCRYIIT